MIYLTLDNKFKNKTEIEEAFYFFLSKLMPRVTNLDVEIVLENIDVHGYMQHLHDRSYLIELNKKSKEHIKTLAHELVHVRQDIRGKDYCEDEAYKLEDELYNLYLQKLTTNVEVGSF